MVDRQVAAIRIVSRHGDREVLPHVHDITCGAVDRAGRLRIQGYVRNFNDKVERHIVDHVIGPVLLEHDLKRVELTESCFACVPHELAIRSYA